MTSVSLRLNYIKVFKTNRAGKKNRRIHQFYLGNGLYSVYAMDVLCVLMI